MAAPPGNDVNLDFSVTLSPPAGDAVALNFAGGFEFPLGAVGGWQNNSAVGTPTFFRAQSFIRPPGTPPTEFLSPFWARGLTIFRDTPVLRPSGIEPPTFGPPTYVSWRRYMYPLGFQPTAQNIVEQVPVPVARYFGGYIPPPGGPNLILNFTEPLAPPPGGTMVLEFGAFGAGNILGVSLGSTAAYGAHFISLGGSVLRPTSWVDSLFGTPDVAGNVRNIFLSGQGIAPPTIPSSHMVASSARALYPGGIAPPSQTDPTNSNRQVPNPSQVAYRIRYILPAGGIHTTYGTPVLTRDIQFIDLAARGIVASLYGTPSFSNANREIQPAFIQSMIFGSTIVKRIWRLDPIGWDSSILPDNAEVVINTRRVYVLTGSADQAEYGVATVFNYNTLVTVPGINAGAGGISSPVQKIFNSNQLVTVAPYSENTDPTGWTNFYPFVENKIRYVRTFGHLDSRFPFTTAVHNNALPIPPAGIDSLTFGPETFIAYRNREAPMQGWDSFYTTVYNVIYNSARVVAPPSLGDTSLYGRPDPVLNLNREVKQHSGWVGAIWGLPFIAPRVRSVFPNLFYDVPWPLHEVRHNPYPIRPVGIPWQGQVGGHELTIRRLEFFPKSVNVHSTPWVGEPVVRNRNIELPTFGNDTSEFGRPDIQNFIRYIAPESFNVEGLDAFLFGSTLIERRTKNVYPTPMSPPAIAVIHRIRKDTPDPPAQQNIDLNLYDGDGEYSGGRGIIPPTMSAPVIRLATIYAPSIPTSGALTTFGSHSLHSNNLLPRTIFEDGLFGTPTLIYSRYFAIPSIPRSDEVSVNARLTPWNIYAPGGDQIPGGYTPVNIFRHVMDGRMPSSGNGSRWPCFGDATVTNQHRAIGPVPARGNDPANGFDFFPKFGVSAFTLRRQYIRPNGLRMLRFGQIIFLNVPQYVNFDDQYNHQGIHNTQTWGATVVGFPAVPPDPTKRVYPLGFVATGYGNATRVELLHRTLLLTGIPHRGNPETPDPAFRTSPWGIPLVGYPRTYVIGMGVQTRWGTHVIEYLNRQVWPVGWVNCSLEDGNYDDFMFPMKVKRVNPWVLPASLGNMLVFGGCTVTTFQRTVYGRGIDGYNAGTPSVKASRSINLSGWNSSEFGDIDRWEAGKIKAHGDDLSSMGTARILNPIRPSSVYDGVVAAPRISPSVQPFGWQSSPGFDGPSVTNPFGCTNRVMTPLPILSGQDVPAPVVVRG
jgi:hypothetical protein